MLRSRRSCAVNRIYYDASTTATEAQAVIWLFKNTLFSLSATTIKGLLIALALEIAPVIDSITSLCLPEVIVRAITGASIPESSSYS